MAPEVEAVRAVIRTALAVGRSAPHGLWGAPGPPGAPGPRGCIPMAPVTAARGPLRAPPRVAPRALPSGAGQADGIAFPVRAASAAAFHRFSAPAIWAASVPGVSTAAARALATIWSDG